MNVILIFWNKIMLFYNHQYAFSSETCFHDYLHSKGNKGKRADDQICSPICVIIRDVAIFEQKTLVALCCVKLIASEEKNRWTERSAHCVIVASCCVMRGNVNERNRKKTDCVNRLDGRIDPPIVDRIHIEYECSQLLP